MTINRKGWDVAQRLAELKANQELDLSTMDLTFGVGDGTKKEPPVVRLRRYLDLINRARTRLAADPEFGRCQSCGQEFEVAALDETPWLERCRSCLSQAP